MRTITYRHPRFGCVASRSSLWLKPRERSALHPFAAEMLRMPCHKRLELIRDGKRRVMVAYRDSSPIPWIVPVAQVSEKRGVKHRAHQQTKISSPHLTRAWDTASCACANCELNFWLDAIDSLCTLYSKWRLDGY